MPQSPRLLPTLLGLLLSCAAHAADPQYYPLTKGAAPQAVAMLDDGRLWYVAEGNGSLGRFDPQSGQDEQVSLGKGSVPRAVLAGPDGEAWIADSGLNALVRVDPDRLGSEVVPLPKEAADAGLDSLVFDDDHDIWFTGAKGFYGRIAPATRKLDVWATPGGKGAQGLAVTPDGQVWYASADDDSINRIDPLGQAVTRFPLPEQGGRPQQLGADSIGRLWVSEAGSGRLGRFDPSDGKWKSWRLPGDHPQPGALYVDAMDRVWLSDLGGDAVLRFDPQSEKFTAYPSDQAEARVSQLSGRPGEVWGADAGSDRLLVIRE